MVEDGYTQINVFARYRTELFDRPTAFGINVSNLADEFFVRARANTGTPRQVMGYIRMEF